MIAAADIARIEQWANSAYPYATDGSRLVVHARGNNVQLIEEIPKPSGIKSRSIAQLRFVEDNATWRVLRVFGGGRWVPSPPADGRLSSVLESLDLSKLPAH